MFVLRHRAAETAGIHAVRTKISLVTKIFPLPIDLNAWMTERHSIHKETSPFFMEFLQIGKGWFWKSISIRHYKYREMLHIQNGWIG